MPVKPSAEQDLIAVLKKAVADAVKDRGLSLNKIAKDAGVSQSSLSRFMVGGRGLSLAAATKLLTFLNLQVTPAPPKKAKRR
jgi:transcriptional regulator with XRE-family HTH domain